MSIGILNDHFGIPGVLSFEEHDGLVRAQIATAAATATLYLHGAHITHWQPAGHAPVLFMSDTSEFASDKPIRGGIPICFPWFRAKSDDPKAPSHGVVRTKAWQLESISQEQDSVVVTLATASDEQTRKWWPFDFRLVHRITVGADLKLELIAANTGSAPFHFEEALHTYHLVSDAANLPVSGLDGVAFLDNRDANRLKLQSGDMRFTQATDNAYLNTESPVEIHDPLLHRTIRLEKQNSLTTVVWNPWQDGARALADLGDDEWQQMACVEASNILSAAITLAPGAEHAMTATIRVTKHQAQ
jgi:glucose-6-phosphate 1-epimerase